MSSHQAIILQNKIDSLENDRIFIDWLYQTFLLKQVMHNFDNNKPDNQQQIDAALQAFDILVRLRHKIFLLRREIDQI